MEDKSHQELQQILRQMEQQVTDLRKQLKEQEQYGVTRELSPSILGKPKTKKKRKTARQEPAEETEKETGSLFEEDFGTGEGESEESESSSSEDEYKPKPLPEFSF